MYHKSIMNAKKFRAYCATGCGRRANTAVAKYCSLRCQHIDRYRHRVKLLETGHYPPSAVSTTFLRRYLEERFGEKCSRCGWCGRNVKTGRVMVEVEHIDGNWRNTRPENLTLLCPNCHALTPTFKALNRGRGRPDRHGKRSNETRSSALTKTCRVEQMDCQLNLLLRDADVA